MSARSPDVSPRILLVLGNALGKLVALTLGHQGYETHIEIDVDVDTDLPKLVQDGRRRRSHPSATTTSGFVSFS